MIYEQIFSSTRIAITIVASFILIKYYIYLVSAPFYPLSIELHKLKIRRLIRSGKISAKYEPLVSIVIPAWNEEVGILTTIKSAL